MSMIATNPPPHQAGRSGGATTFSPALPVENFDFEPPTPDEWRRAMRGLAFAFLRQVSSDAQCFVATRLLAARGLGKARDGAAH
jgi:hypothetical protein